MGSQIPKESACDEYVPAKWTDVAKNHPRSTAEACAAEIDLYCPHGKRGEQLWVRETFAPPVPASRSRSSQDRATAKTSASL